MKAKDEIRHSEETRITVNGVELVYDTFGEEADPPFLLIMGLGAQLLAWHEEFCARLAGRGFYVIRYDNRDVGLSSKMSGMPDVMGMVQTWLSGSQSEVEVPYTLRDMAEDAVGLLTGLGIEKAHVAGASMGGMIAQQMAIHHPERLRSLTLMVTTSSAHGLPRPEPAALQTLLAPPAAGREAAIEQGVVTSRILNASLPFDEEETRERAARAYDRSFYPEGTARQFAAVLGSEAWRERLPDVDIPTLVIQGAEDPLFPMGHGEDLVQAIPDAHLHVVARGGHIFPRQSWPELITAMAQHAKMSEQ
ncbi:MAG: alpha/beta fold hydrolase [Candidatus Promineifilaceae bacterium]|nr:alpha/beta fold hydrolase [Candidatus Promineifilaceae bacterium]